MKAFLIQFGLFCIALFVAMEVFFRVAVLAPEMPYDRYDAASGMTLSDPGLQKEGTFTYGKKGEIRANWRINEAGWNSAFEFEQQGEKPLVAILGDSYIENLYCEPKDHMDAQVHDLLGGNHRVYGFGRRGIAMSQFPLMTRYIVTQYHPEWLVVVINHRNIGESIPRIRRNKMMNQYEVMGDSVVRIPAEPYKVNSLKRILIKSAFYRYFFTNFAFQIKWPRLTWDQTPVQAMPPNRDPKNNPIKEQVSHVILQDILAEAGDTKVLFVLHPERKDMYEAESLPPQSHHMEVMTRVLEDRNLDYIDLHPVFFSAWQREGKKFEFDNNNHWNAYGNAVAAQGVAEALLTHMQAEKQQAERIVQGDSLAVENAE